MPLNPPKKTDRKEEVSFQIRTHNTSLAVMLATVAVALALSLEPALVGLGLALIYTAGRVGR